MAGAAVILVGAVTALVLPELVATAANGQITGRASPTLVDLVAAAATGLAGSLAIARRDIGDILPGVAIAISLVPPLAVVGGVLYWLLGLLPATSGAARMRPAYSVVGAAGLRELGDVR